MRRVLVTGGSFFQVPVVQTARKLGCHIGVIDINSEAPAKRYADESFDVSLRDAGAMMEVAKAFKPDAIVLGACDTGVVTAARVCEMLGLPGNSVETAIAATDKVKMLEAFNKFGVACPVHQVVSASDIDDFVMEVPFPAISKPTDSSAGRGVRLIEGPDDLPEAVRFSSSAGVTGDVLIEEFMEGPEVSVETLVVDGIPYALQVTDKITSGVPYFFEVGHCQPSTLPECVKEDIRSLAKKAALAVGIKNGPAHVEIKATKEGAKMVELGARLGGCFVSSRLINASVSGVDLTEASIRIALGESLDAIRYQDSGVCSAISYIVPEREGTMRSVLGVDEARSLDGVLDVGIMGVVGRRYELATNNSGRIAYVIAAGDTKDEALEICERAKSLIEIEIS